MATANTASQPTTMNRSSPRTQRWSRRPSSGLTRDEIGANSIAGTPVGCKSNQEEEWSGPRRHGGHGEDTEEREPRNTPKTRKKDRRSPRMPPLLLAVFFRVFPVFRGSLCLL